MVGGGAGKKHIGIRNRHKRPLPVAFKRVHEVVTELISFCQSPTENASSIYRLLAITSMQNRAHPAYTSMQFGSQPLTVVRLPAIAVIRSGGSVTYSVLHLLHCLPSVLWRQSTQRPPPPRVRLPGYASSEAL